MQKMFMAIIIIALSQISFADTKIKRSILKSGREIGLSWNFKKSDISIVKSNLESPFLFKDVSIKHWQKAKTSGAPALPFKSFLLIGTPEEIDIVLDAKIVSFIEDLIPSPAQEMPCRCEIIPWKFSADYNEDKYNKDSLSHFKKEYLGEFKGKSITKVTVYPIAYNHAQGARLITNAKLSIKSNNRKLEFFKIKASDKNYNIFSHRKFEAVLAPLIDIRKKQGFNVNFFALDEVGNDFIDIKEFIHTLYENEPFSYSLIIGHEEEFPTEYVMTKFDTRTPSDMNYYTMDGEDDVIPDVLYGRLSVSTPDELKVVIDKTIEFEKRSWRSPAGMSEMIAIASDEGSAPDDVEYVREMQSPLKSKFNWNSNEFFQANENGTAENISSRINAGSIWLNYIGHGTGHEWPSVYGREFNVSDIVNDEEGVVRPVVIDVACQNGRFSNEGRMGETFMRGGVHKGGAVAYYGGSVDISWDPPAIMAIGINKAVSENNQRRLADVIFEGQSYLLENMDDIDSALENLVWYHLQGDPLLNLQNLK
mgnify:CR=1 FL=1